MNPPAEAVIIDPEYSVSAITIVTILPNQKNKANCIDLVDGLTFILRFNKSRSGRIYIKVKRKLALKPAQIIPISGFELSKLKVCSLISRIPIRGYKATFKDPLMISLLRMVEAIDGLKP